MPIHLTAPQVRTGGPDGKGWTRLNIGSCITASDRCALRPRDYSHYRESARDTRLARWTDRYDYCVSDGNCEGCPVFARLAGHEVTLRAFTDEVLVRVDDQGRPWLMDHPEKGWASLGLRWTWEKLAVLSGWYPAETYRDEHGAGFWLRRSPSNPCPSI